MEKFLLIVSIIQGLISFCTLIGMIYGFAKFLDKPRASLEERVITLEVEHKEIKESLRRGNDKFDQNDEAHEVILNSILGLIEFEIQYCLTEGKVISADLDRVKENLHKYLARK